ncbi:hypothetical protein B0H11DRAFT_814491 [Mycena galericulata]|nr:hypothetical protein B0H11DRAFT_814491 [Mycena galericulata]
MYLPGQPDCKSRFLPQANATKWNATKRRTNSPLLPSLLRGGLVQLLSHTCPDSDSPCPNRTLHPLVSLLRGRPRLLRRLTTTPPLPKARNGKTLATKDFARPANSLGGSERRKKNPALVLRSGLASARTPFRSYKTCRASAPIVHPSTDSLGRLPTQSPLHPQEDSPHLRRAIVMEVDDEGDPPPVVSAYSASPTDPRHEHDHTDSGAADEAGDGAPAAAIMTQDRQTLGLQDTSVTSVQAENAPSSSSHASNGVASSSKQAGGVKNAFKSVTRGLKKLGRLVTRRRSSSPNDSLAGPSAAAADARPSPVSDPSPSGSVAAAVQLPSPHLPLSTGANTGPAVAAAPSAPGTHAGPAESHPNLAAYTGLMDKSIRLFYQRAAEARARMEETDRRRVAETRARTQETDRRLAEELERQQVLDAIAAADAREDVERNIRRQQETLDHARTERLRKHLEEGQRILHGDAATSNLAHSSAPPSASLISSAHSTMDVDSLVFHDTPRPASAVPSVASHLDATEEVPSRPIPGPSIGEGSNSGSAHAQNGKAKAKAKAKLSNAGNVISNYFGKKPTTSTTATTAASARPPEKSKPKKSTTAVPTSITKDAAPSKSKSAFNSTTTNAGPKSTSTSTLRTARPKPTVSTSTNALFPSTSASANAKKKGKEKEKKAPAVGTFL